MSTVITITIDGDDLCLRCDTSTAISEQERKYAAIILAALDAVIGSMESGEPKRLVSTLISPTINKRLAEAGVTLC